MASLSTCHLGLWLGWQILLNLLNLNATIGRYLTRSVHQEEQLSDSLSDSQLWLNVLTNGICFQRMVHNQPFYFQVKAQNSMGLSSTTSCQLPTYDMTLPEGRVTPDFSSTSHPGLLQGSAFVRRFSHCQ